MGLRYSELLHNFGRENLRSEALSTRGRRRFHRIKGGNCSFVFHSSGLCLLCFILGRKPLESFTPCWKESSVLAVDHSTSN